MKARVSQLHKTEAEWLKWERENWKPEAGELVVYKPDKNYPYARIKVGDGERTLQNLDFFVDSTITEILQKVRFEDVIDGGRITEYAE